MFFHHQVSVHHQHLWTSIKKCLILENWKPNVWGFAKLKSSSCQVLEEIEITFKFSEFFNGFFLPLALPKETWAWTCIIWGLSAPGLKPLQHQTCLGKQESQTLPSNLGQSYAAYAYARTKLESFQPTKLDWTKIGTNNNPLFFISACHLCAFLEAFPFAVKRLLKLEGFHHGAINR